MSGRLCGDPLSTSLTLWSNTNTITVLRLLHAAINHFILLFFFS